MTRNKFVIRTSNLEDDEEELKKHNELIILVEAVKYCETIGVHRIRYSKLKQISNNKLAALTHGEKVDFGGSFEVYLMQFEKKYQYCVGLIERTKEGGRTYIVPDVKKIAYLFDKLRLSDLFEEERYIRKPILIEYDDNYLPSEGRELDSDGYYTGRLVDYISPPGVYSARYYYRNGHPVFLNQGFPESPFGRVDSNPFYKKTNYLYHQTHENSGEEKEGFQIFASDKLHIRLVSPNDRTIRLSEEMIQRLLRLKKDIMSRHPSKHFKVILDYDGSAKFEKT